MFAVRKDLQLARVEADLARGHTHLALQRLANLTALLPDDPDYRARRGAVNRQIGNLAEAGRWGFLTEDVSPDEVAAFERAFRRPAERLRALRLQRDPGVPLGPLAAARLRDLKRQAESTGEPTLQGPGSPLEKVIPVLGCASFMIVVLAVLGLALVGLISIIR
jgi:hypothetical protein